MPTPSTRVMEMTSHDLQRVRLVLATADDLPFLLRLWNDEKIMRLAGFPSGRNWSEADIERWWTSYLESRKGREADEVQWIVRRNDGTPIGESRWAPLEEDLLAAAWSRWAGRKILVGDIKLSVEYWGQGYGTEALRMAVGWLFEHSDCDMLVTPPHKEDRAGLRIMEKVGFEPTGLAPWPGHTAVVLSRQRYGSLTGND